MHKTIWVIKHGAFGDIINATGAFDIIRKNHPNDHITLMTGPAFKEFVEEMPYFDAYFYDERPKGVGKIIDLAKKIRKARVDRVYDLQNSLRTSAYFWMMKAGRSLEWSGIAPGCSHPQTHPDRLNCHAYLRFADQLKTAGLDLFGKRTCFPDFSWMKADISRFSLSLPYVVLIPGSSKTGSYKRWPGTSYGKLATFFKEKGVSCVVVGGKDDQDAIADLRAVCPDCIDLSEKLTFFELGELSRHALSVIGNDTGPTHMAAAVGAKVYFLWSKASPFEVYAPEGDNVTVIFEPSLKDLQVDRVWNEVKV